MFGISSVIYAEAEAREAARFASRLFHTYGLGLDDLEKAADEKYNQKEINTKMATTLMTRKEAIAKCYGIAYPEAFVQALEALGLIKTEPVHSDIDIKVIEAVRKSGYSGSVVLMELDRVGLKVVEK
jgi:hypothetical protein